MTIIHSVTGGPLTVNSAIINASITSEIKHKPGSAIGEAITQDWTAARMLNGKISGFTHGDIRHCSVQAIKASLPRTNGISMFQ